jgi:peptidoglycan/LPS O-acetylase OafA/YrhL
MRIFPVAYVFLGAVAILAFVGVCSVTGKEMISGLTYTMNFHFRNISWDIGHRWSLAVEEQFYLLWPATVFFLGRRKALLAAAGITGFLLPLGRVIWHGASAHRELLSLIASQNTDSLLMGCLLDGYIKDLHQNATCVRFVRSQWFPFVPVAVLLLNLTPRQSLDWLVVALPLINLDVALCIYRWTQFPDGEVGRILNLQPVRYIGLISYSLYLWQQIFNNRSHPAPWATFPTNLILALACGSLSYCIVEKPFLALRESLERRFGRLTLAAPTPRFRLKHDRPDRRKLGLESQPQLPPGAHNR